MNSFDWLISKADEMHNCMDSLCVDNRAGFDKQDDGRDRFRSNSLKGTFCREITLQLHVHVRYL